jgi:hypothetical protein
VKQEASMHARTRDVQKRGYSEALAILEDPARERRAELPLALPALSDATQATDESLGEPLGIRETAALIGCSCWTVRHQCLRQGLPYFRASRAGKLIFYRNQVIHWLVEKQNERKGRR